MTVNMDSSGQQTGFAADVLLEPEHIEFRRHFRRFVSERLEPLALQGERDRQFPLEVYKELSKGGFLAPDYPEELGGGGGDILLGCVYYEELTRIPAGVSAGVFAHQHLAVRPLYELGSDAQKREYMVPALKAERIGAFALTEPDAGSDVQGIKTRARKDGAGGGDGWIISGSKVYITNGTIADYYILAARTSPERKSDAISLFLVDRNLKGVDASALDKLGNHSSSTALVSFNDVRVGAGQLLGEVGGGLSQLKATLSSGRVMQATRGLGIAQIAMEKTLKYAQEREAFNKKIGQFQGVAFKVAEMAARIEAARLMVYSAARDVISGKDSNRGASMGKFMTADAVIYATQQAVNLHGGYGYMEESGIPRLFRDGPESYIGEGTPEIQLRIIARQMGMHC
ncbi:MAG: acyl-CoA dehydrogenase family protein [Bdellovibrionales bacterium]|nr:acyl-CoA dehydrogenase family protein [Ramlibacter sp.]